MELSGKPSSPWNLLVLLVSTTTSMILGIFAKDKVMKQNIDKVELKGKCTIMMI